MEIHAMAWNARRAFFDLSVIRRSYTYRAFPKTVFAIYRQEKRILMYHFDGLTKYGK